MNLKITAVLMAASLLGGLYLGKTYYAKTETVEVEKEVVKRDVVTVTKEVSRPDGTKEVTTTTTDKTKESKEASATSIVAAPPPQWHISASATTESLSIPAPIYGLQIERRILGPFSLGVRADTNKNIGIVIGMEF